MMSEANKKQVGGVHYKSRYEHWDYVENNRIGYLEACAIKYVTRWRGKDGHKDLQKAKHYVEKLREKAKYDGRVCENPVPLSETIEYCAANQLEKDEIVAVSLLSAWIDIHCLNGALRVIDDLLKEELDNGTL